MPYTQTPLPQPVITISHWGDPRNPLIATMNDQSVTVRLSATFDDLAKIAGHPGPEFHLGFYGYLCVLEANCRIARGTSVLALPTATASWRILYDTRVPPHLAIAGEINKLTS